MLQQKVTQWHENEGEKEMGQNWAKNPELWPCIFGQEARFEQTLA
jgi:hypothetical protein